MSRKSAHRTPSRTQRVKASQKARTEALIGRLVEHMDQDQAQAERAAVRDHETAMAMRGARTGGQIVGTLAFLAVVAALALATSVALDVFR